MIITSYSNIDFIQGVIGYGNATEGITDWRLENTGAGVFNILNSSSATANISIIDNGNVGISTTPITSSSKLEIFGDINITGNYRLNNRDVINDTSNYMLTTSNALVSRIIAEVGHGSNYVSRIATQINTTIDDTSNYVAITCNLLANRVSSQWTNVSSGIHFTPTTTSLAITSTPVATTIGTTGDYTYMSFTYTTETAGAGTGQSLYTLNVGSGGVICDILVVGGGGCGGRSGGGGGAVIYIQNVYFPTGGYSVKVGNGGISLKSGLVGDTQGANGSDSDILFGTTTIFRAIGGGFGAANYIQSMTGGTGGSGGGSENRDNISTFAPSIVSSANIISTNTSSSSFTTLTNQSPNGITIYGNRGGIGGYATVGGNTGYSGGGGGGAGGVGGNFNTSTLTSGAGGAGISINITGSSIKYGSGGASGIYNGSVNATQGTSGTVDDGGGTGAYTMNTTSVFGSIPTPGRGGGGGGWGVNPQTGEQLYAKDGGSGVVIIRFLTSTRNVGIGTTYPTSELHVYDDTTNNTKLTVQNNYVDPIVITPNTIGGYTVSETIESNKYYRTVNFAYNVLYPLTTDLTNLIAWYKLDGNMIDSSGVTGSLVGYNGGLLYTQDTNIFSNLPYAYYTNHSTSVNTNWALTPVINNGNVPITFAYWFRQTSSLYSTMLGYGDKSVNGMGIQFDFYLTSGSSYQLTVYTALSNQWTIQPTATGLSLNTWYFCVYTLSNTSPVVANLYINGIWRASGSGTAGQTLLHSKTLTIGMSGDGGARGFGGNLADIRIYNRVLTQNEISTLYNINSPIIYNVSFNKSTTIFINNGAANTVQGRYNISVGPVNSSMVPIDGQAITPLASTAITSVSIKYEYSNTALSLPALITVSGATSSFIGTTERAISFTYTSDSTGLTGQTLYSFTTTEDLWCDILVVGGGGGGSKFGGGGGAGGVLFANNLKLSGGSSVYIKVGNGGAGATIMNTGVNGVNGIDSSITINSLEYIARGGGGGGSRGENMTGTTGSPGGSGGGGSGANAYPQGLGGASNKNNYANFQSFGNSGGKGRPDVLGVQPIFSSGGGGGAGSVGSDFSNTTGGGNGGTGKEFITYFGTGVGHSGWFAGGGGGDTYSGAGNVGYGNGGLGLYGGGGSGGFDGSLTINATVALPNTGGGGGGSTEGGVGGNGGSGFVIIRYRKNIAQSASLELITSSPINITEPAVNGIKQYPETPSTNSNTWTDNGFTVVCKSSDAILSPNDVYFIFNNLIASPDHYHSSQLYNASSPFNYTGSTSFKGANGIVTYIDLGRSIVVRYMTLAPRDNAAYPSLNFLGGMPGIFKIYASNESASWTSTTHASWTEIHYQTTSLSFNYNQITAFGNFTTNTTAYRYYAMVVYNLTGSYGYLMISEWDIFGEISPVVIDNYHKYLLLTHSGSSEAQTSYSINFPENTICDILIVGGGGGGGCGMGGGGGGGQVIYATNVNIPTGAYNILVGSGGAGATSTNGTNGNNSSAFGATANGGGGGGGVGGWSGSSAPGLAGGSGGGGGANSVNAVQAAGTVTTGTLGTILVSAITYGNTGGTGQYNSSAGGGGGGGGAGGVGTLGNITSKGNGGNGIVINITGVSYYWAGGGGGAAWASSMGSGNGGLGGGGAGANGAGVGAPGINGLLGINVNTVRAVSNGKGADGANNTGGGGGGGTYNAQVGGKGGSGIVIIKYRRTTRIQGYSMGNYNGDFKIISTTSSTSSTSSTLQDTDFMRITRDGSSIYNPTGSPLWSTVSDRRIKENIEKASYDMCYESINKLELYRFSYIKELNNINKDLQQLGYIAQEVQDIFPKAVSTQEFHNDNLSISDMLSIDITQINYSLYGAVKKLIEMYNNKKERLKKLKYLLNISESYAIDTSNLLDTTSNISIDTSNIMIDTSNLLDTTSNIMIDTSNLLDTTSNIAIDTSNLLDTTSNISIDTSNLLDTSNNQL